jgi:hypothetical protein
MAAIGADEAQLEPVFHVFRRATHQPSESHTVVDGLCCSVIVSDVKDNAVLSFFKEPAI